jgi:hypothetical protein
MKFSRKLFGDSRWLWLLAPAAASSSHQNAYIDIRKPFETEHNRLLPMDLFYFNYGKFYREKYLKNNIKVISNLEVSFNFKLIY